MLTQNMQRLVRTHTAGMVATTNADGTPAVSPKATFVVIDDRTIAYGDIRSPGTLANLQERPAIEVCFIDVLARKAVRVKGRATKIEKDAAKGPLLDAFEAVWSDYIQNMSAFIQIDVTDAELIVSPAYDRGATEAELHAANLTKLNGLPKP